MGSLKSRKFLFLISILVLILILFLLSFWFYLFKIKKGEKKEVPAPKKEETEAEKQLKEIEKLRQENPPITKPPRNSLNLLGGGGGKTAWADVTIQCFESGCIYNVINVYDGSGLYAQKGKEGVGVGGRGGTGQGISGDLPTTTPSDGSSFIKIGGKAGEINGGGGGAASPFGNGGNGGSGSWGLGCSPPTPGFRGSGGGGGTYGGGCPCNGAPGGDGYVKIIYFK
jgi:hypothetical protein